jgi:hypothetical protein
MKRILTLGIALVLMAALVIPGVVIAQETTTVTGTIGEAEITITAPGTVAFGSFVWGENIAQSVNNGTVIISETGSRNASQVDWQVTAKDVTNGGYMTSGAHNLTDQLEISKDGSTYEVATTGITYYGTGSGPLPFWAKQNIVGDEWEGVYTLTITCTGSVVFP